MRGLSVSVEVNGDIMVATGDILTWLEEAIGDPLNCHCTITVASLSTASGSVTVQVRVCVVPSYRKPLGTISRVGQRSYNTRMRVESLGMRLTGNSQN